MSRRVQFGGGQFSDDKRRPGWFSIGHHPRGRKPGPGQDPGQHPATLEAGRLDHHRQPPLKPLAGGTGVRIAEQVGGYAFSGTVTVATGFVAANFVTDTAIFVANEYGWDVFRPGAPAAP